MIKPMNRFSDILMSTVAPQLIVGLSGFLGGEVTVSTVSEQNEKNQIEALPKKEDGEKAFTTEGQTK